MRLRQILITSVATATVALISPAITPLVDIPSIARADTRVSVSFNTFYEDLAPHGSWISYEDSYVFVPARVSGDWRPYTRGHWAYTKRYGWLWVSEEPFGWATYHYGRWGYAEDIGWYWVPGKRWAPAWVSWRRSADHVVWAPLPPGRGDDVSVEIEVSDIPDNYWIAVPSRSFLEADISGVIVDDDTERVRVVEAAEPAGNVIIENNVVVNNVIDVDYVEKTTEKKVEAVEVKDTNDPKQAGKESEGQIVAFTGEVQEEKDAKPAEVKDVDAIKKERAETQGTTPQGQTPDNQDQPSETEGQGQTQQPATPEGGEPKGTTEQSQPQQGQEQEQPTQKKKKKSTEEPAQQQETQPELQEQPTQKKKSTKEPAQQQETQPEQQQEQPTQKTRKKKSTEEPAQQEEMQPEPQTEQAPEEPAQGMQPEEQPPAGGCDPAPGQGC